MRKSFLGRITELFVAGSQEVVRQLRVVYSYFRRAAWSRPSQDWSRPDYAFWRRAYYCRAQGLELAGLFIRPIVSKISAWSLGRAPNWKTDSETTTQALTDWWTEYHPTILRGARAALRQGDAFLVVNSDLSLTLIPPDLVDPIVDANDFANIIGWRVTQVQVHPDQMAVRQTIIDEYYADRRIHRVERQGVPVGETVFFNLLGRLPIVHIANTPDDGETFGHPEAEALVDVFHRYSETLDAAVDGNVRQGRPTPVLSFETMEDLNKFWDNNSVTETRTLADGSTETTEALSVDLASLLTVSGAEFEYKSPGSFAQDTETLLGLLFYLILEHTEIPEFVFGNAIASSMASANTQMPVFIRFIEMRRGEMAGWLTELAEIVLAYLSLTTPGVSTETPTLQWEKLEVQDGRLTLDTIMWLYQDGLLDRKTAVMLAPADVEDIDAVLDKADAEQKQRQADMAKLAQAAPNASNQDNQGL